MSCQATRPDLEQFRTALSKRAGLQFDDGKLGFLSEVLQRRLTKLGESCDAYLRHLQQETSGRELAALAPELTVGETYFFRNIEQFRALAEVVLPQRMQVERTPRTLRLLSAGCASGEEAYSLAIVAREAISDPSWEVRVRGVDLNPVALEKARCARYSAWSLRETPADVQRRWFRGEGSRMALAGTVREAVTFRQANLVGEDAELWQPAAYDAIFCRNVLMYFAPEQVRCVVARIARSLAPGGFLFLGHAETLRGISDEFHLRHTHGTFYYERKGAGRPFDLEPRGPAPARAAPQAAATTDGHAWVHAIRRAAERVASIVPDRLMETAATGQEAAAWDMAPALDLLRRERFSEALEHVRAGPPAAGQDPDVLLLEATLLVHGRQLAAAERACARLLAIDELHAGAHYVLGLCREQLGDGEAANEHFQVASYLDPQFAMPRLHQGLLARRCGQKEVARRELAQALALLRCEDPSRLLLFGGGFGREALVALCESALRSSGRHS